MEKGPKIGKSLEGDIAIPEFQKRETKTTETTDNSSKLEQSPKKHWSEIIQDHIEEWPEKEREVLEKVFTNLRENKSPKASLDKQKKFQFSRARNNLWYKVFGISFNQWCSRQQSLTNIEAKKGEKLAPIKSSDAINHNQPTDVENWENEGGAVLTPNKVSKDNRPWPEIVEEYQKEKKEKGGVPEKKSSKKSKKKDKVLKKLEGFSLLKKRKIKELHQAIQNLDNGEPVNEFRDKTRRIVYFDDESQQYFIEKNGARKNLGIGDIVSDYAWGIKYVPDGEMIEPAYRTIAKRILANEARRELEEIRDEELQSMGLADSRFKISLQKLKELRHEISFQFVGGLAEIEVRELLTRLSLNMGLNFVVLRADAQEDTRDKYDFKIRVKRRVRGIEVEPKNIKSIGFQLKTKFDQKSTETIKYAPGHKRLVEEVIKLTVPSKKIKETIRRWVEAGSPPGGPEQFLSRDLQVGILKAVTNGLVEISADEIDKIFTA